MSTVTLAASVVTTAYKVIDFFVSVASAKEDCERLVRELYTTTRMVASIVTLAKENSQKLQELHALLVPSAGLDEFRHTVDELSARILQSNGITGAYKRVNFVLHHQTVQELLDTLQRQATPFIVCLGTENTKLLLQLDARFDALSADIHHLNTQISTDGNQKQAGGGTSSHNKPFLVPFSQDTHSLVARGVYHSIIESRFQNCNRLTLYGLGGTGKSRLAIEFAYKNKGDCLVMWVYAGSDTAFQGSYGKIALTVPPDFRKTFERHTDNNTNEKRKDVISFNMKLVTAWLESDESGNWIMILDNVDDPTMLQGRDDGLSMFQILPARSKGKVLATSRRKDVALSISGSEKAVIHIDTFSPEEAVDCFKQLLPNDTATVPDILSLAQELGFLPLAIRQASAYISQESASMEEYACLLASSETSKIVLLEKNFRDTMRTNDVPNSIFRTWLVSFEQIRLQNDEAAKMLCFMATLDRSGVPDLILKEVWPDPLAFRANIGLILAFSFVGVVGSGRNTYTMHRLIQLSTQTWMNRRGEKEVFDRIALSTVLKLFKDAVKNSTWYVCRILLPHARGLASNRFHDSEFAVKKARLTRLVEEFENPPFVRLSSQQNLEAYRTLSAFEGLVDVFPRIHEDIGFFEWLQNCQPLFLLYGKPGSGKTVACFSVIKALQSHLNADGSRPIVAFFFFQLTSSRNTDIVKALLLDIISQICQQMDPSHVPESVRTLLYISDEPRSTKHLAEVVRNLCCDSDARTFLILDGLDECGDESILEIDETLSYFMERSQNLSILVSSRETHLISTTGLAKVAAMVTLDTIPNVTSLWVEGEYISLSYVQRQLGLEAIDEAHAGMQPLLQVLPSGTSLQSLYQTHLKSVDPAYRSQFCVLLRWVIFAFRALTERELSNIMDIHFRDCQVSTVMEIVRMAKGLLITRVVKSNDTQSMTAAFRPVHASFRAFLFTPEAGEFQLSQAADVHTNILDVCLELLVERGGSQPPDPEQYPVLQYAAEFWPKHLEQARESHPHGHTFGDRTSGHLCRLFDAADQAAFLNWLRLCDPMEPFLGAQPAKNLTEFQPMRSYISLLELNGVLTEKTRSPVQEDQGQTSGSDTGPRRRILCCCPH